MKAQKKPPLADVARRIQAHLSRFEADPEINARKTFDKEKGTWIPDPRGLAPWYCAGAFIAGNRVGVRYVSYQGSTNLTRQDAETYLAWLDAGNVGRHYEALKASGIRP